jgi:hypothetical protein
LKQDQAEMVPLVHNASMEDRTKVYSILVPPSSIWTIQNFEQTGPTCTLVCQMVQLGTHLKMWRAHAAPRSAKSGRVVRLNQFKGVCAKGIHFRVELQKCNAK